MNYREIKDSEARLELLKLLAADKGYAAPASVLKPALASLGHTTSTAKLDTELSWLEEQGLVALSRYGDTVMVRLTARGGDVAEGAAHVPGVAHPRPE